MTPEEVRGIAENAATKAADEAVRRVLTALGFDMEKLHEEQQVWAFARSMHEGTRTGIRALIRGSFAALATALVGWLFWIFGPHFGGKP